MPDLDMVLAPVGGGGLISGTAVAVSELSPSTRVIGAEPANADDACRSLREGRLVPSCDPQTIGHSPVTVSSMRKSTTATNPSSSEAPSSVALAKTSRW